MECLGTVTVLDWKTQLHGEYMMLSTARSDPQPPCGFRPCKRQVVGRTQLGLRTHSGASEDSCAPPSVLRRGAAKRRDDLVVRNMFTHIGYLSMSEPSKYVQDTIVRSGKG